MKIILCVLTNLFILAENYCGGEFYSVSRSVNTSFQAFIKLCWAKKELRR